MVTEGKVSREREMEEEIVIVGGGIIGLATALGLHRNGIKTLILERAKVLRPEGAALGVWTNGWRAIDVLGVGDTLRQKSLPLHATTQVSLRHGRRWSMPCRKEELRCMKRSDLMETLANELPPGTIRFNCRAISVKISPTSDPILHLDDGTTIKSKVVIGCDGVGSIIAEALGMGAPRIDSIRGIRGLTTYAGDGHNFESHFIQFWSDKIVVGRLPINPNLVHWFLSHIRAPHDSENSKDSVRIKKMALEALNDFPEEIIEMVKQSDPISLSLTWFRYRPPWDLMRTSWHKGTVTLAGDALHAMGPYLGQGCSVGLEDAIVLGRCIGLAIRKAQEENDRQTTREAISSAIEKYAKERKMRVLRMASQTYLRGLLVKPISPVLKLGIQVVWLILFGKQHSHAQYDCGTLLAPS
ncbi:hypothetical protein AMTRI_Chr11g158740 [Amborella trichopoda]